MCNVRWFKDTLEFSGVVLQFFSDGTCVVMCEGRFRYVRTNLLEFESWC